MERSEESLRPKRIAAKKVLTYNINYDQVGYYEQRELQRALKYSLIEAEAAKNINNHKQKKNLNDQSLNLIEKTQNKKFNYFSNIKYSFNSSINNNHVDENLDENIDAESRNVNKKKDFIDKKCSNDNVKNVFYINKLNKPTTEEFLNYLCFRETNVLSFDSSAKHEVNAIDCEKLNNIKLNLVNEKEKISANFLNNKFNEKSENHLNQNIKLSMVSNKNSSSPDIKKEKNSTIFPQNENFIQNDLNKINNSISLLKKSKKKVEIISNSFTLNIKNNHKDNLNTHSFLNKKSSIKLESQFKNNLSRNKNLHRPTRKAKPNVSLYDFHIEFDDEEVCTHKTITKISHKKSTTKKQNGKNSKLFSIQTCIKNEIRKKLLQKSIKLSKKYSSKTTNENNLNKNNGLKNCENDINTIKKVNKKLFNKSKKCIKSKKTRSKRTIQNFSCTKSLKVHPNIKFTKNELLKKSELIIRNLFKLRQYLNLKKQQLTSLNLEKNEQDSLISSKITALRLMSNDLQNLIIDPNNFDINTYDPLTISGLLSTTFSQI